MLKIRILCFLFSDLSTYFGNFTKINVSKFQLDHLDSLEITAYFPTKEF